MMRLRQILTTLLLTMLIGTLTCMKVPETILLKDGQNIRVNVTRGDSIKISCLSPVEWITKSRTTWIKDGETMETEQFPRAMLSNLYLQLVKVQESDAGTYECSVVVPFETYHVRRNVTVDVIPKTPKEILNGSTESTEFDDKDYEFLLGSAAEDDKLTCANYMSLQNTTDTPYLCFDLNNKKRPMTHYLVKTAGTTVSIYCNVKGYPKPTVSWLKDDVPFQKIGYQHKIQRNALVIKDVTMRDEGKYTCEVTNEINESIKYDITFEVVDVIRHKPLFTKSPGNITVVLGQTVKILVQILSASEYSINWVKHLNEDPNNVETIQSRTNDKDLRYDNHLLVLENATLSDEGWYSCIAANTFGKQMTSAYIEVVEELPPMHIGKPTPIYVFIVIIFVLIVAVFAIFSYTFRLQRYPWRPDIKKPTGWTKQIIIERRPADDNEEGAILIPEVNIKNVESTKSSQEYELPIDPNWEFPRDRLQLGKHLGEGAFGEVHQGSMDGLMEKGVITTVAVKTLKKTHTDAEMIDLISEMETMKELGKHPNIINLLGCCTQGGDLLVIMEFAEHGNLRDYLRNNRHQFLYERPKKKPRSTIIPIDISPVNNSGIDDDSLTFRDLMSFAYQVARGMGYLVQRKYVHRDLAARNVLVSFDKVVKIADFGMTRSTFTNDYYRKKSDGKVPVKWMAPETLFHRIYTTQSDVWSYGVLLWEIVTLGGTPYPSMVDTSKLFDFLKSGRRMDQPANCPTELYLIMRDCWMDTPAARPTFCDLVEDIGRVLYIASGTEYMELEGVRPLEEVETPPSSPENSAPPMVMFDPEFVKSFSEP